MYNNNLEVTMLVTSCVIYVRKEGKKKGRKEGSKEAKAGGREEERKSFSSCPSVRSY